MNSRYKLNRPDVIASFNNTIQRNWAEVEGMLNLKRWCNHSGPWIADLMQSQSRGAYVSAAVPTITKSHAPNNAYWLVVLANMAAMMDCLIAAMHVR